MPLAPPFNLQAWIAEHRHLLQPPVGNVAMHNGDFLVMVVGGPNARSDFHINPREELFFQVQGNIVLRVLDEGEVRDVPIREGDFFVLPPRVPHSPQRPANTVGIVVEQPRSSTEDHHLVWYCPGCKGVLHDIAFQPIDIGKQIKAALTDWNARPELHTCKKCGTVFPERPS